MTDVSRRLCIDLGAGEALFLMYLKAIPHKIMHQGRVRIFVIVYLIFGLQAAFGADKYWDDFTERDFINEIPQVYSASRLPQQMEDAAGALTVLDREFIAATGSRDLAELFRWVPGFQVASPSGGRAVVAYHGLSGEISQRMQVYVDNRSVYAPYLFGGIDWGVLSVPLDEIERIEIQRGSNSVSYGANAYLGVVHIVTRNAAQSIGLKAELVQGSAGVADRYVRWGYAQPALQWRVSAGIRSDQGLKNRADSFSTQYLDIKVEHQPSQYEEWIFTSGLTNGNYGVGFEGRADDPLRTETADSSFLQARYRKIVGAGEEWSITASYNQESGDDSFVIPLIGAGVIPIDGRRSANRYALDYQHYKKISSDFRASWGVGYKRDEVISEQLFNKTELQKNISKSVYLNAEWRLGKKWTINLGGLLERDGFAPTQWAPRLAINWKPVSQHTFKLGYSSAFRAPSLFEQKADWRIKTQERTLDVRYLSSGGLVPERIQAWDLVYLGQWREKGIAIDARVFQEKHANIITGNLVPLPSGIIDLANATAYDLRNNASLTNQGLEYQLSWRSASGSLISFNQYLASARALPITMAATTPRRMTGLVVSRPWPFGWTTGFTYAAVSPVRWIGESTGATQQRFASLRLARSFRVNDATATVAARWHQPLGKNNEFRDLQSEVAKFWLSLSVQY